LGSLGIQRCNRNPAEFQGPCDLARCLAGQTSAALAKAAPQTTVTLRHLAAALSDSHDLPKKQAEAVLGDLVTLTTKHLKKGDKIRLSGLGILQVRKRAARMGRNPATGEAIKIKASKKIAFRPAKELKEAV
jgi:DNA-binding protein HU-beta